MGYTFYTLLTILVLFVTVLLCLLFIRCWLLGREEEEFWTSDRQDNTEEDDDENVPELRESSHHPLKNSSSKPQSKSTTLTRSRRMDDLEILSQSSGDHHKYRSYSSISSQQRNNESSSSPASSSTDKHFVFPPQKGKGVGLSSEEDNRLPTTRHSFRYNVNLPEKNDRPVDSPPFKDKKRRSLPLIFLHFAQKPKSRKNSEKLKQQIKSTTQNEIIINIQDFDEIDSDNTDNVGLKGNLELPVCDEILTPEELLEVKPILGSDNGDNGGGSGISRSHTSDSFILKIPYFTKRKQETLI